MSCCGAAGVASRCRRVSTTSEDSRLRISTSLWRKLLATLIVVVGFVLLYETTALDSRFAIRRTTLVDPTALRAGEQLKFGATAYCKGRTTASGVNVRSGIAAADPALLPVGSVIQVDAPGTRHDGIYTIMDTGPKVQGRRLDLYMWSCHEALKFGYATVQTSVLRLGWSPQASEPGLIARLFRRREAARRSQPPAQEPIAQEPAGQIPPSTLPGSEPEMAETTEPSGLVEAIEAEPPAPTTDSDSPAEPPALPKRSLPDDESASSPSR
jgi:3D (Asp-Asp-Asp) domain-containing protein